MQLDKAQELSNSVQGWLMPGEQVVLYRLAKRVPSTAAIVELGSWQGRSTIMLAAGSAAGDRARVFAVDFFRPAGATGEVYASHLGAAATEYLSTFHENIGRAGLAALVETRQGPTTAQAAAWNGPPIDLLFIDADHSYRSVMADFLAWAPHCRPGTTVAFHDYAGDGPSQVARFVDRLVLSGVVAAARVETSILYGALTTSSSTAIRLRLLGCPDILPYGVRIRLASRKRAHGGLLRSIG